MNSLNSVCSVLGLDFMKIVSEVHPSLGENEGSKDISSDTIEQLEVSIQRLRELKLQRMQRVCNFTLGICHLKIVIFSVRLFCCCSILAATRSCCFIIGALELDGHSN